MRIFRKRSALNRIPLVEIFSSLEGEGTKAGYPTTFIRLFNCNLRCKWCDTRYSYPPAKPALLSSPDEIAKIIETDKAKKICLTGGEPLLYKENALQLIHALLKVKTVEDIHIETNGSIDISPFQRFRRNNSKAKRKLRFILDYKPPSSGQHGSMLLTNFKYLSKADEIKFVIGNQQDFEHAVSIIKKYHRTGIILFSPVQNRMEPKRLVDLMLGNACEKLLNSKLSLQIHKIIWPENKRGV